MMKAFAGLKFIIMISLILLISVGCSVQKKLSRKYAGEKWEEVVKEKGDPSGSVDLGEGRIMYIYEKSEKLKEAPINTGAFRYDPVISPAVTKKEFEYFYVSADGYVEKVKHDVIYE